MVRLGRFCVVVIAVAVLGGVLTAGAGAASPSPGVSEPHYSLYADFLRLGKLSINPTTHECAVEGFVPLQGECSAESTFSANLSVPSGFLELGLRVEGIAHHSGRVAYSGWGRLSLEFAGTPRVWVEVRNSP